MKWRARTNPKVLIVEDSEKQLQGLRKDLEAIDLKKRQKFGIDIFEIDLARALDEAERSLLRANGKPYDLMLLDLGIPLTVDQPQEADDIENGQRLLVKARTTATVKEIVVVSAFPQFINVANAFRNGAMDFIPKPFKTTELQTRVMECWKRLMQKESNHLLGDKRIRDLIPCAERGLAYRFNSCLTDLERTVSQTSEDLEREVRERFGIERSRNSDDVFFRILDQKGSISSFKEKWTALNSAIQASDEVDTTAEIQILLQEIHQALLSAFVVKNLSLDFVDEVAAKIVTFEDDVQAVLKEILAGAATTVADFDETEHEIKITVRTAGPQVRVSFADRLSEIRESKQINEGSIVFPLEGNFDRAWGLSVVQHLAMSGGGRIEIEPRTGGGNVVNYFIPSAP
jgi:DNA-binding response OmpR family regulator